MTVLATTNDTYFHFSAANVTKLNKLSFLFALEFQSAPPLFMFVHTIYCFNAVKEKLREISLLLANFPKVGSCDLYAVCVSVYPPLLTSECLSQYLRNLVRTSSGQGN
jgi:hypothetical protein